MMILTMDIGGTKILCAFWENDSLIETKKLATASAADFPQLIKSLCHEKPVDTICIDAAGPVTGSGIRLTNIDREISREALQKELTGKNIVFLNDMEALAYSLPALKEQQLQVFRSGGEKSGRTGSGMVLLSVGTGLGVSAVTGEGSVLPSEGGHIDFAPQTRQQQDVFSELQKTHGHVSCEHVLSGQGLANLYAVISGESDMKPQEVTEKALRGEAAGLKTFALFSQILGAACGNYALAFMATGGIYLGGGIMPKILPLLDKDIFEKAFLEKGRLRSLLEPIPVFVILDETAPALGAAVYARRLSSAI